MAEGEGQEWTFKVLANEPVDDQPGKRRVRLRAKVRGLSVAMATEYVMLVDEALGKRLPVDASTTVELLSATMTNSIAPRIPMRMSDIFDQTE